VIEDGRSGFLVPPGDEERFAARLETMLADATLQRQMGAAGRRRIETDFDLDGIAEQVIQLYLTLVS
jgi:glycosyltransferase involved in cell wall biosynthesis